MSNRYEPGLDGLRALAVVAVLAYHDGRLPGGFLGVSAFFTLSGFLITSLLVVEHSSRGKISLRSFFARRTRRLLPAAVLGVLVAAAVTPLLHDAATSRAFRADAITSLASVANWRFVLAGRSYLALFATPSPLQHFWSLAVEVQFYLVLAPVIVAALSLGRGRRTLLYATLTALAALSFTIALRFASHGRFDRAYYGTDARAMEFLVGALLGAVLAGRRLPRRFARAWALAGPLAFAGALLIVAHARLDTDLFRGSLLVFAAFVAVVVVAATVPGPLRFVLSVRPLVWLGRISYGVYVYHWPLYLLLDHRRTGLGPAALTTVRVAATLAVSAASFVFVETPIRRRFRARGKAGDKVHGKLGWLAAAGSVLVASMAGSAVATIAPRPAIHFAPVQAGRPALTAPLANPAAASGTVHKTHAAPAVQRVLVAGDSVALTLGRGIERWGARHGILVYNDGRLGCGLLNGGQIRGYWGVQTRDADPCGQLTEWKRIVNQFRPDVVVVLFGAWDVYDASWDGGHQWWAPGTSVWNAHYGADVQGASKILRAGGAHVIWLAPPCFADTNPGDATPPPWYSTARVRTIGTLERRAATRDGDTVSNVAQRLGCPVNLATRPDGVHYSDPGADAVAPSIGRAILQAGARVS